MEEKVVIDVPEMTQELYAEKVGVSLDVVRGWIKRGYLPTIKRGKYRLVNVGKRTAQMAGEPD